MQLFTRVFALLTVLVLSASGLTSCGKGDAPQSGKPGDSTNASIIDTTQPAKQVEVDSAHVIYFRPKAGEKRRYRIVTTGKAVLDVTDQLMGGPSGKRSSDTRAEFIVREEVKAVNADSSVNISYFIESISASQVQDTSRNSYSSTNAAQKTDPMYDHFTGLIGKEIKVKMSKHGGPVDNQSVTGLEQIADELVKKMPDSLRSPVAKNMRMQQLHSLVNQSVAQLFVFLPSRPVGKDSTWSVSQEINVPVTQQVMFPMTQKSTELVRGFEERAGKVVGVLEASSVLTPLKSVLEQGDAKASLKNFKTVVKAVTRVEDMTGQAIHRTLNNSRGFDFTVESKQQPGKVYRTVSTVEENLVVELLP